MHQILRNKSNSTMLNNSRFSPEVLLLGTKVMNCNCA